MLTETERRAHITCILKSLYWLPVSFCINFKLLLFVYKALHGLAPDYLSEMLLVYEPGRPLRSSTSTLLAVPQSRTKTFGETGFSRCAPSYRNSLLEDLRGTKNIDIFGFHGVFYNFMVLFVGYLVVLDYISL